MEFTELDKKIVRALQDELPLVAEPFKLIAEEIDSTEDEVLERLQLMRKSGALRKMGAVLKHREVGFAANALCVWVVPDARMDEVAVIMCRHGAVTHCYDRNVTPDWPYNFYTMIHGSSREECEAIARQLAEESGVSERQMLYTGREWKKTSMSYFI
ncbi:MAG: Lrp/AsnC family transcriptional regulator [Anaerovibrio sp.]|nr:Lrp/AsnC family transcriptional regulator [Anaerovibrio sp.]